MRDNVIKAVLTGFALLSIALLAPTGCGESLAQPAAGGPPASLSISYSGTTGKVGHHMSISPVSNCGGEWSIHPQVRPSLRGSLPPGMKLNDFLIEGIPQQPGRWQVWVSFSTICQGKLYSAQDVAVTLNIEGIAPRRIP